LNSIVGNRMYQITQGDSWLHLALKAHKHRLWHIERHNTGCCGKGHKARTRWEGNTQRESCVRVTARANRVRQQHTVQPAVNDAVTRTK